MKNVFYASLLALLSVVHVYGAPDTLCYGKDGANLVDQIKFGMEFSVSSPQALLPFAKAPGEFYGNKPLGQAWPSIGAFGECPLSDQIGLRLSLGHDSRRLQSVFGEGTLYVLLEDIVSSRGDYRPRRHMTMSLNYLTIAPTLRMYLGKAKQFCVFLGPKFGYLVRAKCTYYDAEGENVYNLLDEDDLEKLSQKNSYMRGAKVRRCVWGITFGWDYESKQGLILGMLLGGEVGLSGIVVHDTDSKPMPCRKNNVISTSKLFSIGYNMAKLF